MTQSMIAGEARAAVPAWTIAELEAARELVYASMDPTPQLRWPLLGRRCGADVWVKHENHTPIGAFKLRGGVVYMDRLRREQPEVAGVLTATRGNHGQSVAFAAREAGLRAVVVVPRGNSIEKNDAMRALGAELIEHGRDFQESYEFAAEEASNRGLHMLPSFHPLLSLGIASCGLELLQAVVGIDTVYVPIGQGSGICAMLSARNALGLSTRVVGVVTENAAAYALSFAAGEPRSTDSADTIADGLACRVAVPEAVAFINREAERVVTVSEAEIRSAMRHYFTDTHNIAEGAGAAPLAALLTERDRMAGKRVALVLSGGNVDRPVFADVLAEDAG